MNKFIKYPLTLGVIGAICAFALAAVHGVTEPIIAERVAQEAFNSISELYSGANSVNDVTATYADLDAFGIDTIYEINNGEAYAYQAGSSGYGGTITSLIIVSNVEDKILGYKTLSHAETKGGNYGDTLLSSPLFDEQFKGLAFDNGDSGIDFVAGATAKITLSAVKSTTNNVIKYHNEHVKGGN